MQCHPRPPKTISKLKTIHSRLKVNFNPANGPHLSGFKTGYLYSGGCIGTLCKSSKLPDILLPLPPTAVHYTGFHPFPLALSIETDDLRHLEKYLKSKNGCHIKDKNGG